MEYQISAKKNEIIKLSTIKKEYENELLKYKYVLENSNKSINDLRKSGAEAISINGERVLPLSEIKCSGATITINSTMYGQPFIIKAIGNGDSLMASILSPQSYVNLLRESYGIFVEAKEDDKVVINSIKY